MAFFLYPSLMLSGLMSRWTTHPNLVFHFPPLPPINFTIPCQPFLLMTTPYTLWNCSTSETVNPDNPLSDHNLWCFFQLSLHSNYICHWRQVLVPGPLFFLSALFYSVRLHLYSVVTLTISPITLNTWINPLVCLLQLLGCWIQVFKSI